ncbi:nucleoside deaminase [Sagittula sp. NFXS13]|uniref:nucleoside deaminase n=1 Tax=Sagittula sp. NFXS13 TaxID=2819095 RepID=UPI0032DFAE08
MKDHPDQPTAAETAVMNDLIDRARAEADTGGKAGIAAAVMRGDTLLARGMNEVHLDHDPTRHAEIVALSAATRALKDPSLDGCTLLTTLQPCEMCLAAMRFAGIARVIYAAGRPDVPTDKYFAFPGLHIADFREADHKDFTAIGGLCDHRILDIYAAKDD